MHLVGVILIKMSVILFCTNSSCWEEAMVKLPYAPEEFQQHLSQDNIVLMASSPPGQSIQKYFFYAQQVQCLLIKRLNAI